MNSDWPTAALDPVQRLRALAAGVRGAAVSERVYAAPSEDVWRILGDLEDGFGRVQPDIRTVRIIATAGDRVEAIARSRFGMRAHLTGVLRPGWCWLQSRYLIIGMAAADEGEGRTRVALTGGVRIPRRSAILPVGVRREAAKSLDRLSRLVEESAA